MDPFTALMLGVVVPYLISAGAGLHADAALQKRRRALEDALHTERRGADRSALIDRGQAGLEAQLTDVLDAVFETLDGLPLPAELSGPLNALLDDADFRADLITWLRHWYLPIADDARDRLTQRMQAAHLPPDFPRRIFETAEVIVFADPVLANWRLHLALHAAGEERAELLRRIRERDGVFDDGALADAEALYRALALKQHDIVDLHGLPEDDRALATTQFVLRQLYIPLRVEVEPGPGAERGGLDHWETRRHQRRRAPAPTTRQPVGALLTADRRVVVLGDPGGGKTTLMRWFATALLLRLQGDADLAELPDVAHLPDGDWLPILVRCRALPAEAHSRGIDALIDRHLEQLIDLGPAQRPAVRARLLRALEAGEALLIIDGLDEINDARDRARFCRRLELVARTYDRTPMLVTSRVVGYRQMPGRLGPSFRHTVLSDLTPDEMDAFARRWAEATALVGRQQRTADDLIANIHSSERVERLAGNPMLLTTLALVHRKIGRLPQRRHQLYREALNVLLNWRGELDERLTWDEAIPQLQYLAYVMCRDGVQQLTRDRVIDLLDAMRAAYGRLRAVRARPPEAFLDLLEHRSSLLIEAGRVQDAGRAVAVYEFRHLTFQEYLAALALVDGRFPGHDRKVRLPERIAPLAGVFEVDETGSGREWVVTESWREPLRLCLIECSDDDVDLALFAVLETLPEEDDGKAARARAIMAALCLADEPAVSVDVATRVLGAFVAVIGEFDGGDFDLTSWDKAIWALAGSAWRPWVEQALWTKARRSDEVRLRCLSLLGLLALSESPSEPSARDAWLSTSLEQANNQEPMEIAVAALAVMQVAFTDHIDAPTASTIAEALLPLISREGLVRLSSAWALWWLSENEWFVDAAAAHALASCISEAHDDLEARQFCTYALAHTDEPASIPALVEAASVESASQALYTTLGRIGTPEATGWLQSRLDNHSAFARLCAVEGLAQTGIAPETLRLLRRAFGRYGDWRDPLDPIDEPLVLLAAYALRKPIEAIRALYAELAPTFGLRLAWLPDPDG